MIEVIATGLVTLTMVVATLTLARVAGQRERSRRRTAYRLAFPRGIRPQAVESFVRSLSGLQPPRWKRVVFGVPSVAFEVHASHEAIEFWLLLDPGAADFVLSQARRAFPGVRVNAGERRQGGTQLAAELRLPQAHRILRVEHPEEVSAALLAALRPLGRDEHLSVQWVIAPASSAPPVQTRAGDGRQRPAPDNRSRDKLMGPHFWVVGRLTAEASSLARRRHLLRRLLAVMHSINAPGASLRRRWLPSSWVASRAERIAPALFAFPCYFNARELTALLGIPMGEHSLPGLDLGSARQLPVPSALPTSGPAFAVSNWPGSNRTLTFGPHSLPYHGWVLGGTGSGKSTLLKNILAAYMRLGATIVVIDSKRDLVHEAVELVPRERIDDLVLVDPSDEYPVGINLLAGADNADRVADQLVGLMSNLWPGYVGPRSQDILRASFVTLAKTPGTTFVELPLLLQNDAYRRKLVARLDDPIVLEPQWAAFEQLSASERAQHVAPVMNKVRAVLGRRALRDVVGQAEGLDVAATLERGSILMVALSKGLIGEDAASLLGSLVLTRVWQALTARVGLASTDRRPTLLVLDEFQDYMSVPMSFGDMLAQARALAVGVIAAHQHLGQLPPQLRADLRANARSKIAFQLAAPDARVFAQEFTPHMTADDLQALGRYEVAAQLCVDGQVLQPATGTTFPPPEPTGAGKDARERSRRKYGRSRPDIEAEIRARHGEQLGEGAVGRRRRR